MKRIWFFLASIQLCKAIVQILLTWGTWARRYCTQNKNGNGQMGLERPLLKYIEAKIRTTGAITVSEYMQDVLTHPSSGYYMTGDVFGSRGDFITSPEISQIFGELLGVWCVDQWYKMGKPVPLNIVELGPGRGTLANDLLRVLSQFRNVKNHISLHLVEISSALANIQIEKICPSSIGQVSWNDKGPVCYNALSHHGIPASWYLHLQDVPREFSIFIAHEFFDAMPIHKFQKTTSGWKEVLIDFDDSKKQLKYVLSKNATPAALLFAKPNTASPHLEVSPKSGILVQSLASRVVEDGGAVLIADYGHCGEGHDTFRAFRKHKQVDPLCDPGSSDLTCDVDFSYLKEKALENEVLIYGPVTQKTFLSNLGIQLRLQTLLQTCDELTAQDLKSGCNMLLDADQMGERFKFLGIYPAVMEEIFSKYPPSGFT